MTRSGSALVVVALGALVAGCGGGGGGGGGGGTSAPVTSGTTSPAASFVGVAFTPDAAPAATTPEVVVELSRPVDLSSVVIGTTLVAVEDTDTNPGGTFRRLDGTVTLLDAEGRMLAFAPARPFRADQQVRVLLTSGVLATDGTPLEAGGASAPISLGAQVPGAVFEGRFSPQVLPAGATPPTLTPPTPTPPPPAGATPPGVRPSVFTAQAGTDVWHVDFDVRAALLPQDFAAHGLRSGDAATDQLARDLVLGQALAWASQKYGRTSRGQPVAGQSWKLSFTAAAPANSNPGQGHSREACGGVHQQSNGILGSSLYDPGNQNREDNANPGRLGIFCRVIFGTRSTLDPALVASDRRYLEGSYTLGSGTDAEDARLNAILRAASDWGHALGSVIAHEVGHSVGLPHDESDPNGLMRAAASSSALSNTATRFSGPSAQRLDQNLGRD